MLRRSAPGSGSQAESIRETVATFASTLLTAECITHESLVVGDANADGTAAVVNDTSARHPCSKGICSHLPPGFGHAVRTGLDHYAGDTVATFMADSSDSLSVVEADHPSCCKPWHPGAGRDHADEPAAG
jgi:dolichol-phosphate mannosyltransferase